MSDRGNREFASYGRSHLVVLRGRWGRAVDRVLVRWTGWSAISYQYSLAGRRPYTPVLLLTTIGRRTGRLHTVVLPYVIDGDTLVVIGSMAGGPKDPQWAHNIRATSTAWIRIDRRNVPVLAHVADGAERERLFDIVAAQKSNVPRYQERASTFGRLIPLVVLEPRQPLKRPVRR